MDFDDVLNEVGSFGLYQKLIICAVLLPAAIPCAFHAYRSLMKFQYPDRSLLMSFSIGLFLTFLLLPPMEQVMIQLFIAAIPEHWCRIPELEPWTKDYGELVKNLSIPVEIVDNTLKYSECKMYARNYSEIVRYLEYRTPYDLALDKVWDIGDPRGGRIINCQNGWHYDTAMYPNTVVSEWDLVCENNFYITLGLSVFGIAGLVGNYIFGYLQDIWGRRPSFYLYLMIEILACAGSAFAWDYYSWIGMRFIVGLTVPAILSSPYVLAIELVGPEKRVFCTIVSNIAYSFGLTFLAGVVYLVRDWRFLSLAVSLPLLLLFSCFFVLPESPRWLAAFGKTKEAAKVLKTIARVNGKDIPTEYTAQLAQKLMQSTTAHKKGSSHGIMDLFRSPNLRKKTIIITFIWFTNTSVYVGLSYYAPALGGDEIWNFFLAGAVELPTYLILWPGLHFFGRRWVLCLSMLTGGIACITTFLYAKDHLVMIILYCIGKMGISSSYVVLPLLASELYPTVVRGLGMSFSGVIAMIGPILIPIINHMGEHMLVLPLIVMGVLLVVGGLATLLLPETKGKNLPQTLEEGETVPLKNCFACCQATPRRRSIPLRRDSVRPGRMVCSVCKNEIKNSRR